MRRRNQALPSAIRSKKQYATNEMQESLHIRLVKADFSGGTCDGRMLASQ